MDYLKAFVIGGLICVIAQIVMDNTKLMPGRVMVILVCIGAILGAIGVYKPFLDFAELEHQYLYRDLDIICGWELKRR